MAIICHYDELTLVKILEEQLSFSYCEIVLSPDLGQKSFQFQKFWWFLQEFHLSFHQNGIEAQQNGIDILQNGIEAQQNGIGAQKNGIEDCQNGIGARQNGIAARKPDIEARQNGKFTVITSACTRCASRFTPKGLSPGAHLGDGLLDLVFVSKTSRLNYFR